MTKPTQGYLPILVFGCLILVISFGSRASFGLFLPEMTVARGWSREVFSFAFAVQNVVWGIAGSLLGAYADRFGARRVLILGGVLYALGLVGMAYSETGAMLTLTSGVLIGIAVGGTAFGLIFSIIGKVVPPEKRSLAFGFGTAAGSFGQFLFLPFTGHLIGSIGWHDTLLVLSGVSALIILLAFGISGDRPQPDAAGSVTMKEALAKAFGDRSFHLLFWGYFVCGLQVVFIALHLPVYLQDQGLDASVGATAVALIGLFNIIGSLTSGALGQKLSKKWMLASIYVLRSLVMIGFLIAPLSVTSVYVFAAMMGLLWLSTVPPTTALVGQMYGVRYLGTLGGVIFLGHQLGSFLGAWLGGRIFDETGSYDIAWVMVIAFGAFAAVMHMPIDQRPLNERALPVAA